MSEQMTMDELLSHLMLMGFNPEDCHEAVSCGKLSAQDAVEWILSGKPRTSSSAHLVLPKQINKAHDKSESSHSNPGISDGPQCPSYQTSKPNEPPVVHSRFAESRDARVQFLNNKRIRLEQDVKKEKMNKKMEKEAILKEIECDRKAKRELKHNPDTSVAMPTTSTAPSGQHATCLIQIRLPNGQNVRHKFPSQQTISHVVEFTKTKVTPPSGKRVSLLQPFPRMELNEEDGRSIEQLGFCPTASLVARFVDDGGAGAGNGNTANGSTGNTGNSSTGNGNTDNGNIGSGNIDNTPGNMSPPPRGDSPSLPIQVEEEMEGDVQHIVGSPPPGQRYSFTPPRVSVSSHRWPSGGHRLGLVGEQMESEEPPAPQDDPASIDPHPSDPLPNSSSPPDPIPAGGSIAPHRNNINPRRSNITPHRNPINHHIWGEGRDLMGENVPELNHEDNEDNNDDHSGIEARRRREQMMRVIENRLRDFPIPEPSDESAKIVNNDVETLLQKSLRGVLRRIKATGRATLSSLGALPLPLSEKVLSHLVDSAELNPNTVPLFRSCPPTKLVLDYYKYATNQLLHSCRIFTGLRVLSLRSCSLLTDHGCTMLSSLPNLQYLDVSGCSQLANQLLHIIQDLEIKHLALDGTRVSDEGISHFLKHKSRPSLVYLSLRNLKGITSNSMRYEMKSLRLLFLDKTSVQSLEGVVTNAPRLQCLSIGGCIILSNELAHLSRLSDTLTTLNVKDLQIRYLDGSVREDGNLVFQHLRELSHLKQLEQQFRLTLTDEGVKYIRNASLTSLNLSHHRGIDDGAVSYISTMTCLTELDLTNTRISDVGLLFLSPILLRLTALFLAKTAVTSRGVIQMLEDPGSPLTNLSTLSLQCTNIGNRLLRSETLNQCCPNLVTLILRDTKVSDSGLRHLKLPNLTHLLLTGTRARCRNNVMSFPACPALQFVEVGRNLMTSSHAESGSDENDDL